MRTAQEKFRLLGLACVFFLLLLVWRTDTSRLPWIVVFALGFCLACLSFLSFVFLHISILIANRYVSMKILFLQYLVNNLTDILGAYFVRAREKESIHCEETQEKFLLRILSSRAGTAYGKDHGFANMTSIADFRQRHPLTTYSHYASYVERVARGEDNVMTVTKPSRLGFTSGTTGQRKLIILTKERQMAFLWRSGATVMRLIKTTCTPSPTPLQTCCLLYVHTRAEKSEGGIPMGPVTMISVPDVLLRISFTTPVAGMKLTNEHQAMYVHLLFALRDRNIKSINAFFSATLYAFFSRLENEWRELVNNLRQGRLSDYIELDEVVRASLQAELSPEPERAAELEREFQKGFDGIASRIWPRMQYLIGISSGPHAVYYTRLQASYTKGLRILSTLYNSTEGMFGTMYGENHEYVINAAGVFFEFIPVDRSQDDQPYTLLAEEVKVGQSYEVAITNIDGLYRYRMGDVIKVTGFYHKAPVVDFQYRSGELFNLTGEKTPEVTLRSAIVETFESMTDIALVDYACVESVLYEETIGTADMDTQQYYVIFVELDGPGNDFLANKAEEITSQCDHLLCHHTSGYAVYRQRGNIGRLKLVFVQPGSFVALRAHILSTSRASAGQIKIPKKLRKAEWVKILSDKNIDKC